MHSIELLLAMILESTKLLVQAKRKDYIFIKSDTDIIFCQCKCILTLSWSNSQMHVHDVTKISTWSVFLKQDNIIATRAVRTCMETADYSVTSLLWTPSASGPHEAGTTGSVLIREMSLIQRSLIERFHCISL